MHRIKEQEISAIPRIEAKRGLNKIIVPANEMVPLLCVRACVTGMPSLQGFHTLGQWARDGPASQAYAGCLFLAISSGSRS